MANSTQYPQITSEEEIVYKVYYYTDKIPKPGWIGTQTFDDLEDAAEYADYRMRANPKIKKTAIVKVVQTTEYNCLVDTLRTRD